jgi:hypothetical protein
MLPSLQASSLALARSVRETVVEAQDTGGDADLQSREVDVGSSEYIAISALRTLTTPVPWDAPVSDAQNEHQHMMHECYHILGLCCDESMQNRDMLNTELLRRNYVKP